MADGCSGLVFALISISQVAVTPSYVTVRVCLPGFELSKPATIAFVTGTVFVLPSEYCAVSERPDTSSASPSVYSFFALSLPSLMPVTAISETSASYSAV